ncbi:MAG: Fic family protein, partial [Lachnospiraceae bacterium]|nr:Fic family protein [Lachnospiraceae bacterium]
RFTAAHELCHHIKDRRNETCPKSGKNSIEKYAERFAAELLMPADLFHSVAMEYADGGKVSFDDALIIAERFGVSFQSCVLRLAYRFNMIDGDYTKLNKLIKDFKPDIQKKKRGIDLENIDLLRQAVDSYTFFFTMDASSVWYRFKADFIYNENRMEGIDLDEDEVSEIVADLRLNGQNSDFCKESYEEIIEVVGHSDIYDYIFSTTDKLSIYKLLDLNRMLFSHAPFPEESGKTRTQNTLVLGTKFETVDYRDVAMELYRLQEPVEKMVSHSPDWSISDYLLEAVRIHHRITQIHPFRDGNGRCSRALLNWMLRVKGLPPIYIKSSEKETYYKALEMADCKNEYKELLRVVIKELFHTIIRMNS